MATLLPTSLYHSNAALCALLRPATSDEKSPVEVAERMCTEKVGERVNIKREFVAGEALKRPIMYSKEQTFFWPKNVFLFSWHCLPSSWD